MPLNTFADEIFSYTRATARCLYEIHKNTSNNIMSMDDRMIWNVQENHFLTEEEKDIVIRIIEALPKGNSNCHGDPNPNNIMVDGDKLILIDWVNAGVGNPMYDIAEYVRLITPSVNQLPKDTHPMIIEFFTQYKDDIIPVFLEEYERVSNSNMSGYSAWLIPILVSHLNSNRTLEEKYRIVSEIRTRLEKIV
jgi:thiamine kinase-like enzyme